MPHIHQHPPRHNRAIAKHCSNAFADALLDVLHVPPLALDSAAITAGDKKTPGHTKSITKHCSKFAPWRVDGCCPRYDQHRPRSRQIHREAAQPPPGHSRNHTANVNPWSLNVLWIPQTGLHGAASLAPGRAARSALLESATPKITVEPSPSTAVNALTNAWTCCPFLDGLHVPPLTQANAAITASYRKLQVTPNPSPSTAANVHSVRCVDALRDN